MRLCFSPLSPSGPFPPSCFTSADVAARFPRLQTLRGQVVVVSRLLSSHLSPAWRQMGDQCVVQTTSWSQCSRSCGMGVSSRVTNDNARCKLIKETRLCNIRPCSSMSIPVKVRNVFSAFKTGIDYNVSSNGPQLCRPANMLNGIRKGFLSTGQIGINIMACVYPPGPEALCGRSLFLVHPVYSGFCCCVSGADGTRFPLM